MSKCTAAQALAAFENWLEYYEKATIAYAQTRDKSAYALNKGSNNYTFAGYLCGVQAQPWCAAMVSLAIHDACGYSKTDAAKVMRVWPYINCGQMWDNAPASAKGRRGAWTPIPGDIIVFTDNGQSRDHTGMVYAVDAHYVYTYEGNSGNMCRKRSYLLTSTYIYGYVRPDYAEGGTPSPVVPEKYGKVVCSDPELHLLSKGTAGPEVKTVQRILYARGIKDDAGKQIAVDGDFGKATKAGVIKLQKQLFPGSASEWDGEVGAKTWRQMLRHLW